MARTAQTTMESEYADDQSYAELDAAADLKEVEPSIENTDNGKAYLSGVTSDDDSYTVTVTSATGNSFAIRRPTRASSPATCTVDGKAFGCPSDGTW